MTGKQYPAEVVNKNDKERIFREMHDSAIGGHPGESKIYDKVRKIYYWAGCLLVLFLQIFYIPYFAIY